mmetsp:Transcript_107248/g.301785  ORF Transcript_107248/g.301785 Transcript_107248/m.301785 type:complete len:146 (-) Transcript_107248:90-527(-)
MGTCNCHDGSDKTVEKLGTAVVVHIYDLGRDAVTHFSNSLLHAVGLGVYHVGVEVYGAEWSYCLDGVYSCPPSSDPLYPRALNKWKGYFATWSFHGRAKRTTHCTTTASILRTRCVAGWASAIYPLGPSGSRAILSERFPCRTLP